MEPYRCPVCNGKGVVPTGFYNSLYDYYISSSAVAEKCRSCNGSGIVWGEKDRDEYGYNHYWPAQF